ncbi:MAG: hypothetical protein OCD01_13710 [Fibrobacterales bacterium]
MITENEIVNMIIISVIYLVTFSVAELWRLFFKPKVEYTRKFVHLSSGLVCLSFSYVFESHISIAILASMFALIMIVSKKFHFLKSVHGINRKTHGGIYYPVAVYGTFFISTLIHQPDFYFISILVLSISDTFAAFIGGAYGVKKYKVEVDSKSVEGSFVFFMLTFIIILVCLLLLTGLNRPVCILLAFYVGILITIFESLSTTGADNFFIPMGTIMILYNNAHKSWDIIAVQIGIMTAVLFAVYFVMRGQKKIGSTGILGAGIICYGSWALVNESWAMVIFIAICIFSMSKFSKIESRYRYRVKTSFFLFLIPLVWLVIARYSTFHQKFMFVPYVICLGGILSCLWGRQIIKYKDMLSNYSPLYSLNSIKRSVVLTVVFLPAYFITDASINIVLSIPSLIGGIFLVDYLSRKEVYGNVTQAVKSRVIMLYSVAVSAIVFGLNYYIYTGY